MSLIKQGNDGRCQEIVLYTSNGCQNKIPSGKGFSNGNCEKNITIFIIYRN
eukprot:GAHX01007178.1.p1 GENE.GAHX01007178.1~~GAHX01007178.1.p1  ORF type:complete len:51 (+),score=3.45 GAHX01007178.1:46-198(+)